MTSLIKNGTFCQVHLYHKYTYLSSINDPKLYSKPHLQNSFAEGRAETSEDSASNAQRFDRFGRVPRSSRLRKYISHPIYMLIIAFYPQSRD